MNWLFLLLSQEPMPDVNIKEAVDTLIGGISTGAWILIAAGGGLVLVWALRLFLLPKLTGKALAIVSTCLIAVAATGTALIANPSMWLEALGAGLAAGLVAGKMWDVLPDWLTDALEKQIKVKREK